MTNMPTNQPIRYYAKQRSRRTTFSQSGKTPSGLNGLNGKPQDGIAQSGQIVGYGLRQGATSWQCQQPPVRQFYVPGVYRPQQGFYAEQDFYAAHSQGYAQMPSTNNPQHEPPRKKKRAVLWVCIAVAALCVAAAVVLALFSLNNNKAARSGSPGQLEGKTPAEMQAELDRIVEDGMFNISIASVVQVPNGTAPAELRIENVPGNRYLMKVVLTLDDTGQQIYATDVIEPNFHIQQDVLDVDLEPGMYDATAVFTALDPETEEEVGQAAAQVLIQVQS